MELVLDKRHSVETLFIVDNYMAQAPYLQSVTNSFPNARPFNLKRH